MVTLLEASGGYVDTTLSDSDGAYAFPLPLAGRYIVTMVNPATYEAMARKLAVENRSLTVDLAAPRVEEKSTEPVSA